MPHVSCKQSFVLEDFLLETGVVLSHEVLGVKLLAVLLVQLAHLVWRTHQ